MKVKVARLAFRKHPAKHIEPGPLIPSCEILRIELKGRDQYFSLGLSNIDHGPFDYVSPAMMRT